MNSRVKQTQEMPLEQRPYPADFKETWYRDLDRFDALIKYQNSRTPLQAHFDTFKADPFQMVCIYVSFLSLLGLEMFLLHQLLFGKPP